MSHPDPQPPRLNHNQILEIDYWICGECNQIFRIGDADLRLETERLSGRAPARYYLAYCPECGSGDLTHPDLDQIMKHHWHHA